MAGTPVGASRTPTFPASSPQSDQAGSPSPASGPEPEPDPEPPPAPPERRVHYRFQHHCHPSPIDSVEFTLKAGLVHRLLEHVIDVSDGVAAWLEVDERERPKPPPDEVPPAVHRAQDTAMRGLCVAALELIGDQSRRLTGWVCEQQFHAPEFGVMPPRRRRPPVPPR